MNLALSDVGAGVHQVSEILICGHHALPKPVLHQAPQAACTDQEGARAVGGGQAGEMWRQGYFIVQVGRVPVPVGGLQEDDVPLHFEVVEVVEPFGQGTPWPRQGCHSVL